MSGKGVPTQAKNQRKLEKAIADNKISKAVIAEKDKKIALLEAQLAAALEREKDLGAENKALREENSKLIEDNHKLAEENSRLQEEKAKLGTTVDALKHYISILNNRRYSRSSEANCPEQLSLFGEGELEECQPAELPEEKSADTGANSKKKYNKKSLKNILLELPANTKVVVRDLRGEEPPCDACGNKMVKTGELVTYSVARRWEYVIVKTITNTYGCPNCDADGKRDESPLLLKGSICDPTLLANVVLLKFGYGLPLYRVSQMLAQEGFPVSRQTISSWLMKAADRLVDNLQPLLEKEINTHPLLNVDETPLKVVRLKDGDGKPKAPNSRSNAYMMVRAATDSGGRQGPIVFTFLENRRNQTIEDLLAGYHGIVQSDGLSAYKAAASSCDYTSIVCLVHARRKMMETSRDSRESLAKKLLDDYDKIFKEETPLNDAHRAGELTDEEFLAKRKAALLPLYEALKAKMEAVVNTKGVYSNKFRSACQYFLARYDRLIAFLDYPFATSSNQAAENAIRPFASARKSWLFNITELGAEASALYYSLVQSCIRMGIDANDYLIHLFMNAGAVKDGDVEGWTKLLPGKADLADAVEFRKKLETAKPDPKRTEGYILRGARA